MKLKCPMFIICFQFEIKFLQVFVLVEHGEVIEVRIRLCVLTDCDEEKNFQCFSCPCCKSCVEQDPLCYHSDKYPSVHLIWWNRDQKLLATKALTWKGCGPYGVAGWLGRKGLMCQSGSAANVSALKRRHCQFCIGTHVLCNGCSASSDCYASGYLLIQHEQG